MGGLSALGPVMQRGRVQPISVETVAEEEVEPPKMMHREKQKRLQYIKEVSANLREPMDGKVCCFLTKSQKSLAKLELSNREELKIG